MNGSFICLLYYGSGLNSHLAPPPLNWLFNPLRNKKKNLLSVIPNVILHYCNFFLSLSDFSFSSSRLSFPSDIFFLPFLFLSLSLLVASFISSKFFFIYFFKNKIHFFICFCCFYFHFIWVDYKKNLRGTQKSHLSAKTIIQD